MQKIFVSSALLFVLLTVGFFGVSTIPVANANAQGTLKHSYVEIHVMTKPAPPTLCNLIAKTVPSEAAALRKDCHLTFVTKTTYNITYQTQVNGVVPFIALSCPTGQVIHDNTVYSPVWLAHGTLSSTFTYPGNCKTPTATQICARDMSAIFPFQIANTGCSNFISNGDRYTEADYNITGFGGAGNATIYGQSIAFPNNIGVTDIDNV